MTGLLPLSQKLSVGHLSLWLLRSWFFKLVQQLCHSAPSSTEVSQQPEKGNTVFLLFKANHKTSTAKKKSEPKELTYVMGIASVMGCHFKLLFLRGGKVYMICI